MLAAWLDVAAPYQEFAGKFFKNAAEPSSPLSPFSPESAGPREESIALYRQVVEGSDLKVAKALREELPELLWLLQMGVVLFWVYDASEGQRRTRTLVDGRRADGGPAGPDDPAAGGPGRRRRPGRAAAHAARGVSRTWTAPRRC